MFGLESKDQPQRFEFDLEKDLKEKPNEIKKILTQIDSQSKEIKSALRSGAASENFDQCGVLLQGYEALERVVNRIKKASK